MIEVTLNYIDFKNQLIEKYGEFYAKQTEIFFERSIFEAKKNFIESALIDAKYALNLSYLSNEEYSKIFIIGFISQMYCDQGKIKKAKKYYQLGMRLIENKPELFQTELILFEKLKELIDSESWKENLDEE